MKQGNVVLLQIVDRSLAAELLRQHKLATADAIVYATARHHHAELLTCDGHFRGLPGVLLLEKTASS